MASADGIVADGYWRLLAVVDPQVRAEVEAEYAGRLEQASFWERRRLKREMAREIKRRVDEKAPPYGLY